MGRWEPDSQGRLAAAAFSLYAEQGFDQTTAAEIAARAGVTERTFFRHFADKREVLFAGSEALKQAIVGAVEDAPAGVGPLDAVARGLETAAALIGPGGRERARQRHQVISANPELRERELSKLADYADAVAAALGCRGVAEGPARLAAETGMTIFRLALARWAGGDDGGDLTAVTRDAVAQLRSVASD